MSVIQCFTLLYRAWIFLIVMQLPVMFISASNKGIVFHTKNDINDNNDKSFSDYQPFVFIAIYNTILIILYFLINNERIITIGIPAGSLFFYLSLSGDLNGLLFRKHNEEIPTFEIVMVKNMLFVVLISIPLSPGILEMLVRDISACSEFYFFVEVVMLVLFCYIFISKTLITIYILLGIIQWDSSGKNEIKLANMNRENDTLKANMELFVRKIDVFFEKRNRFIRILLSIPGAALLFFISICNYSKQLIRNIKILGLSFINEWIIRRRMSLKNDIFHCASIKIKQYSMIITLGIVYVWLSFEAGEDSIVRNIMYGFSTIIIIPIAINRITTEYMMHKD